MQKKRMKTRISYRYTLLIRVVLSFILGFLLISAVLWTFFRNNVRNIGYYFYYGKTDNAVLLIAEYLGDPPSKIKSKILTKMYNITVIYHVNEEILWATESKGFQKDQIHMMREMMQGMGDMNRMGQSGTIREKGRGNRMGQSGMMTVASRKDVYLAENRVLSIYVPMHLRKRPYFTPFVFLIMVIGLIGLIIFLSVKKTLKPLDRIMEAAGRIGRGDLSYRIQHDRNDDFGKVADAFNTMGRKLSAMLSNQRELLHFISHELRTPLTRINLALEIKDKDKSAQLIKNEIHEIDTLVGQVLDLSRMDYEDQIKKNESIDLVAALNKIIKKYDRRDIHFNPDATDTEITGSEVLIQKAFSNLIDNAVKYSPEGGVVDIGLRQEDDKYKITIENRGPGLSEKEVDKIWEPFYRGENSRVNNIDGKGLGLVIVKKAIKLSSGDVQVKSSTDGPTVFTVTLPRKTNVSDYAISLIE